MSTHDDVPSGPITADPDPQPLVEAEPVDFLVARDDRISAWTSALSAPVRVEFGSEPGEFDVDVGATGAVTTHLVVDRQMPGEEWIGWCEEHGPGDPCVHLCALRQRDVLCAFIPEVAAE